MATTKRKIEPPIDADADKMILFLAARFAQQFELPEEAKLRKLLLRDDITKIFNLRKDFLNQATVQVCKEKGLNRSVSDEMATHAVGITTLLYPLQQLTIGPDNMPPNKAYWQMLVFLFMSVYIQHDRSPLGSYPLIHWVRTTEVELAGRRG